MCHRATNCTYLPQSKMQYCREMRSGQPLRYSEATSEAIAAREVDANILKIDISTLEDVGSYATGDPFKCTGCGTIFNVHSKKKVIQEGTEKIWECEQCLFKNKLTLDEAGYPTVPIATYILNSIPQKENEESLTISKKWDEEIKVIQENFQKLEVTMKSLEAKEKEVVEKIKTIESAKLQIITKKKELENSIPKEPPTEPEALAKAKELEMTLKELNQKEIDMEKSLQEATLQAKENDLLAKENGNKMQELMAKRKEVEVKKQEELSKIVVPQIKEQKEEVKQTLENIEDQTIIFCIDVSGSMDGGVNNPSGRKMKYVRNGNYITRLEAVKAAVDAQLEKMKKEFPNRKVGFVTFESEVQVYGDCTQTPLNLDHKYWNDFFGMVENASDCSQKYLSKPIKETSAKLLENLAKIETHGCTALGPALVASTAIAAKGSAGSKVIICTDGLANEGMGSVESSGVKEEETKAFYTQVGQYAQQHGVVVSVISLVASECRLDLLSPIAGLTGGDILRVDPMNLSKDFSSLLSEKVIATQVAVRVKLHKIMMFNNVPEQYLSADKSVYTQEIGSATRDSVVTCSYTLKPVWELTKMTDIDYKEIKQLPMQTQIEYKALDGKKCIKVISELVNCSEELHEARRGQDKNVVTTYCAQSTAKYTKLGRYEEAMYHAQRMEELPEEKEEVEEMRAKMNPMKEAIAITQAYHKKHGGDQQLDELTTQINLAMKKS